LVTDVLGELRGLVKLLNLNDLLNATLWLGSIWDVFQYFDKRASIRDSLTGINSERFPLAYCVLRAHDFTEFGAVNREELGAQFQLDMLDNLGRYSERNQFSHYVNSIVHELHTRHPEMDSFVPSEFRKDVERPESRAAYLEMAAMLNGLPSSNKAYIGRRLKEMLAGLKDTGQCGCFGHKRLYESTVFVFCGFSKMERTERIRSMNTLVEAALLKFDVKEVLGIAIEADDERTGCDLRWVRGTPEVTPHLARVAEAVFGGPLETSIANPFGDARPYTPPKNP
jgi:hypothetical protein